MKTVTTFGLLLVASIGLGGITNSASAQDDPEILLKLAKRAQNQISNQISDSSDNIKRMFNEGIHHVESLEKALQVDDIESAKEHFLSAMKKSLKKFQAKSSASDSVPQAESTTATYRCKKSN